MKYILHFVLATLFLSSSLSAQNLGLDISLAQYMTGENESYIELNFSVDGASLVLNQNENKAFQGGIEVIVKIKQDSIFKIGDKFRIISPEITDTSESMGVFIQQERYALANGEYTLFLELYDYNNPGRKHKVEQPIEVYLGKKEVAVSDITFLDHYNKATKQSRFAKSGFDLIPMVISGTPYFPTEIEKISYYSEIYNLSDRLGLDEAYILKQYIENNDNGKISEKHARTSKHIANGVLPILSGFAIGDLASGNYNLVIEVIDREQKTVLKKKEFFYRENKNTKPLVEDIMLEDLKGTFVSGINNFDTLYKYIKYLYPISTEREQGYQKNLLASRDKEQMKRYFFAFWQRHNREDPRTQWLDYYKNVRIANHLYNTRIQRGYMTERGRVFLTYGSPSLVEDRKFEPNLPPYQIWQYNVLNGPYADISQNNKFFIFAELEPSTNDYELIHSTAYGELNNRRWRYDLAGGSFGNGDNIDSNSPNNGDGFGSRLENNVIFQSGNR